MGFPERSAACPIFNSNLYLLSRFTKYVARNLKIDHQQGDAMGGPMARVYGDNYQRFYNKTAHLRQELADK